MTPLTMHDVIALGEIVNAAISGKTVAWVHNGDVIYGTARSIGDESGYFLSNDVDIRDGYLRITSHAGFEMFLSMSDVMKLHDSGEFIVNPFRP